MNNFALLKEIDAFINRNKIILKYSQIPVRKNTVNLHMYHPEVFSSNANTYNMGDYLSEIIVSYMCDVNNIVEDVITSKTKHLYAIGSILLMGYQNATVWGSGFPFEPSSLRSIPHKKTIRNLDIRCVRGPLTKMTMDRLGQKCPEVYGDPATLLPLMYNPKIDKKIDYLVIPHYQAEESIRRNVPQENVLSMNTNDYKKVVDKICSAKRVISSSLHGIILAESYGIPAVFYFDMPEDYEYKYRDWYESTGRINYIKYTNFDSAFKSDGNDIPNLDDMRDALIRSFPSDLWK